MSSRHCARARMLLASMIVATGLAAAATAAAADRAVLQVTENDPAKWNLVLANARNLQRGTEATGGTEIEIVAFGPGVLALKQDSALSTRIHESVGSGIHIVACQNTMASAQLKESDMLPDIGYVPSGIVEVMRKQQQGYAYIRP